MTVFVYVDTNKQVGDKGHIKVFANQDATWFEENGFTDGPISPEGRDLEARHPKLVASNPVYGGNIAQSVQAPVVVNGRPMPSVGVPPREPNPATALATPAAAEMSPESSASDDACR
jgi:hypothetical protein